ncbi:MAG: hypothetical protein BAA01_16410 [Bacillus thermozeamaize]|uniref:C4-dicarboxylate ABC transporter n=1 Tax=Bacillus thermozeamaize TaxID=230954 RepID=A0A1Y3PRT8_9BACI|nr:MAG: hypothetical protein BAA01_16410 [Bacillus thermozeamaize]
MKRTTVLPKVLDWCLLAVAITFLLSNLFFAHEQLRWLLTLFVAVLMGFCIPWLDRPPRATGLMLFFLGAVLLFLSGAPLEQWIRAYSQNMNLLMLFVLVPLLGMPLKYGHYTRHLSRLYHRHVTNRFRLYLLSGGLSLMFSPVLNLAAITMIKDVTPRSLTPSAEQALYMSLSRTYGLSLSWTPYFGTVILVLSLLNVSWPTIAPITLGFALTVFAVSCLMEYRRIVQGEGELFREPSTASNGQRVTQELAPTADGHLRKWDAKIVELVIILILLIAITIGIHEWFHLEMTLSVSLVSIFFPVLWTIYLKKWHRLLPGWRLYFRRVLPRIKNEIFLFMNAGFFGGAVVASGYGEVLPQILEGLTGNHPVGLIAWIGLTIILFPIMGIHPLVLPLIYAAVLPHAALPLHLLTITFVILASWSIALSISPFSAATLVVIRGTAYSNYQASVGWNWRFCLMGYGTMLVFAIVLHFLLR